MKTSNHVICVCKRCFKPILGVDFSRFGGFSPLCSACLADLNPHFRVKHQFGVNIYYLYEYNETFRNSLFLLKGCGDFEIRHIFLDRVSNILKIMFRRHILVPAPSFHQRDATRGFNHVVSIFERLDLPFERCLVKTEDRKQADLGPAERSKIGDVLTIENGQKLVGKRILLVDDVFTTGSTIKACLELIRQFNPKRVDVLVLARVERT